MDPSDILAQMRDIHMPPEPGLWPPAPGWWLLGIVVLIGLGWLVRQGWQALARYRLYRRVARELAIICERHQQHGDAQKLTAEISRLLRRAALREHERERAAGLIGDNWLTFLDQTGHTETFSTGPGRCLATAPYGGHADPVDAEALAGTVRRWLRMNLGQARQAG
jgi:hypothetical protein